MRSMWGDGDIAYSHFEMTLADYVDGDDDALAHAAADAWAYMLNEIGMDEDEIEHGWEDWCDDHGYDAETVMGAWNI